MSSIKKNFIYNSAYQVLTMFIPLITTPYISRVLGAEKIGIYSYAFTIAKYYVMFIMLGLNNYGNRSIAAARNDRDNLSKTFWSIYAMQITTGVVVSGFYLAYSVFFAEDIIISCVFALYVISACIDINWFFFGMEKFRVTVTRNMIIKLLTTLSVFAVVKTQNDIYKYCFIIAAGTLVSQVALWPFVRKLTDFYRPSWGDVKPHIKPNLALFLTVIGVSLFKMMDKLMLGGMTDKEQVGFYESAEKVITIPTMFVTSLGTVMLPRMTNMLVNKEEKSNELINKSIIFALFLASSMGFGIMGVAKTFVPLFYGPGYDLCITLFVILLPTGLFMAFANVIRTQYLLPHHMDREYIISSFVGAAINIAINLLLIPNYGAVGAAVGTLFAELSVCVYQAFSVRKGVELGRYVKNVAPLVIAGVVMFLILFNWNIYISDPFIELLIKIVVGVVIYFAMVLVQLLLDKYILKTRVLTWN